MPLGALSALLGLAGGAQVVGQGLGGIAQRLDTRETERRKTALELALAGYQPQGTPTAANHPLGAASGALAHAPAIPASPTLLSVPELQPAFGQSPFGDAMGEQGGGAYTPQSAPVQPQFQPPAMPQASSLAPQAQPPGAALSALIQPRQFDIPGIGAYEETPQAFQQRSLALQKQQADLAKAQVEVEEKQKKAKADESAYPVLQQQFPQNPLVLTKTTEGAAAELARELGSRLEADRTTKQQGEEFDRQKKLKQIEADLAKQKFKNYVDPQGGVHLTTAEDAATKGWIEQTSTGGGGARGFGPGGVFGAGSALGSIEEMHKALPNLEKYEFNLLGEADGSPGLKAFDVFRQKLLDAGRHASGGHGAISTAISSAMQTGAEEELARINPELAEYGRNVAQWIVNDLNLTRSATDERGRWDQVASSVLGGLPLSSMPFANRRHYVQQIVAARRARLGGLDEVVPAARAMVKQVAGHGGTAAPPTASGADPEFDALMASLKKP